VMFGHIIREDLLRLFPRGIANLHPSLLPEGRGCHPNAWAIARQRPMGVTFHLVDAGVDTGPILAQESVVILPVDTASTLYDRAMIAAQDLLDRFLDKWLAGELRPRPQTETSELPRRRTDLERELQVIPEKMYSGRELIDLLRARTFFPHQGALYEIDGKRLRLRIQIEEDP
jgi:methionyl-tRNA formyltransferase